MSAPLDVVYYVRPGERNPELRYSLRSLSNLPHGRVLLVGHKPTWVQGVEYVRGNEIGTTEGNAIGNLRLACEHAGSDRFVVFNDDFFVMEPMDEVPSLHAGPLSKIAHGATTYRRQLQEAARLLEAAGFLPRDLLAWTLHIPVVVDRERLSTVLRMVGTRRPIAEWRTVYGNYWGVTGEEASDVKVRRRTDAPDGPFLSTQDATFEFVASRIKRAFPTPSPYEAA